MSLSSKESAVLDIAKRETDPKYFDKFQPIRHGFFFAIIGIFFIGLVGFFYILFNKLYARKN